MSRTYRRQHSHLKSYAIPQVDEVDAWDLRWSGCANPETHVAQKRAHFHSDAGSRDYANGGVPHWFRRHLNKRVARDNRDEIYRCTQADCWDDFQAARFISNAGWYWW